MELSLAPLQGYTEYPFRNAFSEIIGGVDKFYTPFLRFENDGSIRNKHINDILPENNQHINLIPQILVNNTKDFLHLAHIIEDFGYTELNWNLGCPFPMVAKRKLGSGLLAYPEAINQILEDVLPKTGINISVKLRSGYTNNSEIIKVIEVLNQFPLSEVIFHPRIGKQLYKGRADITKFSEVQLISKHKMAYNGDIDAINTHQNLKAKLKDVQHFMIGRALIANPFLANEIKTGEPLADTGKRMQFYEFHNSLLDHYKGALSGNSHVLNKFTHYWEYFSHLFNDEKKIYKIIKKCKSVDNLKQNADFIIRNKPLYISENT